MKRFLIKKVQIFKLRSSWKKKGIYTDRLRNSVAIAPILKHPVHVACIHAYKDRRVCTYTHWTKNTRKNKRDTETNERA